ncbi:DEAD/DEAH box helicase [Corynebacterium spheniscorum]|nr:DEAD/DEAH box helicase [Corynebacterium spheniscorum]
MDLLVSQEGLVRLRNGWLHADSEDVAQLREEIALLMGGPSQKLAAQLRRLDKEIEKTFRATSRGHFNARQEATTALRLLQKQRVDLVAELRQALISAQAEKTGSSEGWKQADSAANQQLVTSLQKMRELKMHQAASGLDDPLLLIDIAPTEEEQNADRLQSSWVSAVIDGESFQVAPQPIALPDTVEVTLRHYQKRGVDWLYWMSQHGLGAVLADDMGLGKTLQVLAFLAAEKAQWEKQNAEAEAAGVPEDEKIPWKPTVVIAPTSVLSAWQREAARFVPSMTVYVHHGNKRVHDEEFAAIMAETDLCITSYNLLTRDIIDLCQVEWAHVVVDEAQMIKNTATAAAKAARKIPTDHRIALTGTPVENRLAELRSIIDFCNPGALGSAKFFRHTYARPIEGEDNRVLAEHLKQITSVFILRRVKTDTSIIDDLPEKEEHIIKVRLTEEQAALYQGMVKQLATGLACAGAGQTSQMGRRGLILASLTRFKQICNHPAHFLADGSGILDADGNHRSGKVEELMNLIDHALHRNEKMIIFTQYKAFGKILQPFLSEYLKEGVPFLHGGVSRHERSEMVRDFQRPEGPHVMILSLRAGGTGLTLTAANHVVHMDRWWNPAVENQATDRAFRIGQTKDVMVHKMVSEGTMEEAIQDVLEGKLVLVSQVLGEGEGWITELPEEQLLELVEYSREEE